MGFCHLKNSLFLGGGLTGDYETSSLFRRIYDNGKFSNLNKMVHSKYVFPLVHWQQMDILFTIGGHHENYQRKEVEEYSLLKNKWKIHSQLPKVICNSDGIILRRVIYNFGGDREPSSIICCDLSLSHHHEWKVFQLRSNKF